MKRSRRMLSLCGGDSKLTTDSKDTRIPTGTRSQTYRKIYQRTKSVSSTLYTSPSTGNTLQVLQNALEPRPKSSQNSQSISSTPPTNKIRIIEDSVINTAYNNDDSDSDCEIFPCTYKKLKLNNLSSLDMTSYVSDKAIALSTPLKEKKPLLNSETANVFNTQSKIINSPIKMTSEDGHIFSTPNTKKKSLNHSSNIALGRDSDIINASSTLTSRCRSFSDIGTSDIVSMNSSFNEEQFYGLLSLLKLPSPKPSQSNATKITLNKSYSPLVQPSTSNFNNSINTKQIHTYSDDSDSDSHFSPGGGSSCLSLSSTTSIDDGNSNGDTNIQEIARSPDDEREDITESPVSFQEYSGSLEMFLPSQVTEPHEYYELFLTDEIVDKMVEKTNKFTDSGTESDRPEKSRSNLWKPTNRDEMHKFLGILLVMGLNKVPHMNGYWSKKKIYRNEYIVSLMSRDRFLILLKYWHFSDNYNTGTDKLYKIREVYEMLMSQFRKMVKPEKVMVIDETMVPWRGRLMFRQYIKNKSHKYGVKLYKACTPEGYTFNLIIYTGKEDGKREVNHAGNVVMKLIKDYESEGRIVVVDNFYTSIGLSEALLKRKTFICGTLRSNRKGLPKSVISKKLKKEKLLEK